MKRVLLAGVLAAGLAVGGAGIAQAGHTEGGGGLGPRPDGEVGPRCAAALEHAASSGSEQGQASKAGGMEKAMANCQRAVDRFAERTAE